MQNNKINKESILFHISIYTEIGPLVLLPWHCSIAPEGDRTFTDVAATEITGFAHWEAKYVRGHKSAFVGFENFSVFSDMVSDGHFVDTYPISEFAAESSKAGA